MTSFNKEQQIEKMNAALDHYQTRLNNIESIMQRPMVGAVAKNTSGLDVEHKNAFTQYLKRGIDGNLANIERKALSVSSNEDGGYFVTRDMMANIADNINHISVLRNLSSVINISTEGLDIIDDEGKAGAGWTGEVDPVDETQTPKIAKRTIHTHEIYAQPKATQKLIDDAAIDIDAWLVDKISQTFSKVENFAFIHGDGNNMPRGILTYPNGKGWGQIERVVVENQLVADSLFNLLYTMDEIYSTNACFLMHRSTLQAIRMMKSELTGEYIWAPSIAAGQPDTLLGLPVMTSNDMPAYVGGGDIIALADFKEAYQVVDRNNMNVLRDPFTEKPFVKFYTTKRVGGDVKNFNAIKLLNLKK
jgi:HK97 family phage major capsid protein